MPIDDPTRQVPKSDMRLLRPIGLGLLSLLIGFNGAYLLIWIVGLSGGPDLMEWVLPASLLATVLTLAWLIRRSRRKREAAARRAMTGQPRPLTRVMVASVLMTILGLVAVWLVLRGQPVDVGKLGIAGLMLMISAQSLVSTVMELRARRRR
ncbi:hypothetical protein [Luteimonas sp. A478]